MTFEEWWDTVKAKPGAGTRESCRLAWDAATERAAVEADLAAENFRESAVLHGADEPAACYRSRAAGATAAARRIREGKG